MSRLKIAISLEEEILRRVDELVDERAYPNRSRAIEAAISETLAKLDRGRLARECAKLDPKFEKALAEEGIAQDVGEWPEY